MVIRRVLALLAAAAHDVRTRVRTRWRSALARALRLTVAAVASYLVASVASANARPVLAPLTALLVVQVTLFRTVYSGWQRVISVVAGVLLAVIFSSTTGLTWWSLGVMVAVSIVIGQLLRLGDHLLEVPISAMLVLAVGAAESAATDRIAETLIGAAVGVVVNVVFPPPVQTRTAGQAVEYFGAEIAELLERASRELSSGVSVEAVGTWLEDARRVTRHVSRVERVLANAEESRRLNVRAFGTADPGPMLQRGLDALEHTAVAVRTMFRSLHDAVRARPERVGEDEAAQALRIAFAVLLEEVAEAVRNFAAMVRREAEPFAEAPHEEAAGSLEALREARARLTDLLLVDPREDEGGWELNSALLTTVERVLRELDVEEHARARDRQRRELDHRRASTAAARLRQTTRQFADKTTTGLRQR